MPETIIEQIKNDLFRAEVPLPRNPLKATNSYIIKNKKRNLVIDTGMNRDECKSALLDAFRQLDINLENTDFFITHLHADHIGLVDELAARDSVIYFNEPDAAILNRSDLWQLVQSLAGKHGFPENLVNAAIDSHPGQRYSPKSPVSFTMVKDGDLLLYGDYELQAVTTPGHTNGHTCLYEPQQRLLFSGDHILGDITPNISTWLDAGNPLQEYFTSLDRVYEMDISLVLPGHRSLIRDCRQRIEQLKEHHRQRLEEVLQIFKSIGEGSAFAVASRMTWDLVAASWDDFPLMQKWFATGEALAHIHYLEQEQKLERSSHGNTLLFSLV
jgi:glyoxylase-like metal-dependent hydrolase (beta-lactamase superfamily II)